ncbi:hypothetical protein [Fervidibacter sacchari]
MAMVGVYCTGSDCLKVGKSLAQFLDKTDPEKVLRLGKSVNVWR